MDAPLHGCCMDAAWMRRSRPQRIHWYATRPSRQPRESHEKPREERNTRGLLFLLRCSCAAVPGSHQDMIAIMVSAQDARRRSSLRSLCPSSQSPSSLSIISAVSVRSTFAHAPSGWQGSARLGASLEAAAAAGWGAEGRCGVAGQARGAQG